MVSEFVSGSFTDESASMSIQMKYLKSITNDRSGIEGVAIFYFPRSVMLKTIIKAARLHF